MPLERMPNGEYVDVPDGISPDALNRIRAQNQPTPRQDRRAASRAPVESAGESARTPRQERIRRLADRRDSSGVNGTGSGIGNTIGRGLTLGFQDEIVGGLTAVADPLAKAAGALWRGEGPLGAGAEIIKGVGRAGETYREARDVQREVERRQTERAPVLSMAGEIAGAVGNPLGTGARVLQGAGRAAAALGASRAGQAAVRAGQGLANAAPTAQAIAAGTVGGAVNAAGVADELENVPGAVGTGALIGGVTGGVLGGGLNAVRRAGQTIRDSRPDRAAQTAYLRVAGLLDNAKITPARAQREIEITDARGGDAMVQDLTPGLRAQAAAISRRPNVRGSNELIERGDQRIAERAARYGNTLEETATGATGGVNAVSRGASITAGRKAAGQVGYEDSGLLDRAIEPTPEITKLMNEAPEPVKAAFRSAYDTLAMRDQQVANFVGPDGVFTHMPNLRTFDAVSRALNEEIGAAIRAGKQSTAGGLSYQLDKIKGALAKANPNDAEYQAVLLSQRDEFQKAKALELGTSILSRLPSRTGARDIMAEVSKLTEAQKADYRVGALDALLAIDAKRADPVQAYRNFMRTPAQREVMAFVFNGKGNLNRFDRWVNRELRGKNADVLTAPGRQSETSRIGMASEDNNEAVGSVLSNALRGYAFGGSIGALSGVSRTLQNIANGSSKAVQEEMAKILLSKGNTLTSGIEGATAFANARTAANKRIARAAGTAGQQPYSSEVGGD